MSIYPDSYTCQKSLSVNTGFKRSMTILVRKYITEEGVTTEDQTEGFPVIVDGKQAFGSFLTISRGAFDALSDSDFSARMSAFATYLDQLYPGIVCPWEDGRLYDGELCPVPVSSVTYSLQNITPNGTYEKEFDVVVSDDSVQTINYYLLVERMLPGEGINVGTYIAKSATIDVSGAITKTLTASAGSTSMYFTGSLSIAGSAHIKMTLTGQDNTTSHILDVRASIRFDDNENLEAVVTINNQLPE